MKKIYIISRHEDGASKIVEAHKKEKSAEKRMKELNNNETGFVFYIVSETLLK